MSDKISAALAQIEVVRSAMAPADRAALEAQERQAQRESWIRGMAPCEHGVLDWETCDQCRAITEGQSHDHD
ncbi:MAG: hypothetical protein M3R04_01395 [bacterium]|nr:hypothetical protein [bacterium]